MCPILEPYERTAAFTYCGQQALYRDQHGHRVLVDVDGWGRFRSETFGNTVSIIVDDVQLDKFEGEFKSFLNITASSPGCFSGHVTTFPNRTNYGPLKTGEEFNQSGWIFSAEEIHSVDGENCPLDSPVIGFPIPFFQKAVGKCLSVASTPTQVESIANFSVGNASELFQHRWKVKNGSQLSQLNASFPGGQEMEHPVMSHLNAARFVVQVPEYAKGLRIRKLYDAFHGRQRARVLLEGAFVGWWYEPVQDRQNRWRWTNFGFNLSESTVGREVEIQIDPPAGAPLWSVARLEVWVTF